MKKTLLTLTTMAFSLDAQAAITYVEAQLGTGGNTFETGEAVGDPIA